MSKTNWDLKSGDIVAMNNLPDAALYVVTQVEGVKVGIQDIASRRRFPEDKVSIQWADISSCKTPSVEALTEAVGFSLA
jgi:hypothetical protein